MPRWAMECDLPNWATECDCLLPTRNGAVDHGGFFLGVRVGMHSSRHVLSASLHASYRISGRETTLHSLLQTARVQPVEPWGRGVFMSASIFADSDFRCVWTYTLRRVRMTHESGCALSACADVVSVGPCMCVWSASSRVRALSVRLLDATRASRMPTFGDALVATSRN